MQIKLKNQTNYADIYFAYENGKVIGTIEHKIAGAEAGKVFCHSWSGYGKREIRKAWTAWRKER